MTVGTLFQVAGGIGLLASVAMWVGSQPVAAAGYAVAAVGCVLVFLGGMLHDQLVFLRDDFKRRP